MQHFAKLAYLAVFQQLLAEHADRGGGVEQGRGLEAAHSGLACLVAIIGVGVGDLQRGQHHAVFGKHRGALQGQAQAEQAQGQAGVTRGHAVGLLDARHLSRPLRG
ncbi:hypothetical protein D3C75_1129420 [compost metagenome]